jgi:hypothetical protein
MAKRKTISENPLDMVVSAKSKSEKDENEDAERSEKERVTFHITKQLIEKARDAVYWTPGLTMAGLAELALRDALDKLEKKRGESFPNREGQLKYGRPIKMG